MPRILATFVFSVYSFFLCFAIPPHFFGSFFAHPSTSDPLISLAIYHHLKVENICLNIQRNMRRNNMPLEDNYGESSYVWKSVRSVFCGQTEHSGKENHIPLVISLCLQQLMHHWKWKFIVFLKRSRRKDVMTIFFLLFKCWLCICCIRCV